MSPENTGSGQNTEESLVERFVQLEDVAKSAVEQHLKLNLGEKEEEITNLKRLLNEADFKLAITELERDAALINGRQDELTTMLRQIPFKEMTEKVLGESLANGKNVCMAIVDLDKFKAVNDILGHETGDKLLQVLGPKLVKYLRETDFIEEPGRIGGDEFAVIGVLGSRKDLHHNSGKVLSTEEQFEGFKTRLRSFFSNFVSEYSQIVEGVEGFGATLGFASTLDGYTDPVALKEAADTDMYRNKPANSR